MCLSWRLFDKIIAHSFVRLKCSIVIYQKTHKFAVDLTQAQCIKDRIPKYKLLKYTNQIIRVF